MRGDNVSELLVRLISEYEERAFVRYCEYDADYVQEFSLMEQDNEDSVVLRDALRRALRRAVRWHGAIVHLPNYAS